MKLKKAKKADKAARKVPAKPGPKRQPQKPQETQDTEEPLRLYLEYDEYRVGGEICEGEENDPWPNREDTQVTVSFTFLHCETSTDS